MNYSFIFVFGVFSSIYKLDNNAAIIIELYRIVVFFLLWVNKGHHYVSGTAKQGKALVVMRQSSRVNDAPSSGTVQHTAVVT